MKQKKAIVFFSAGTGDAVLVSKIKVGDNWSKS